LTRQRQRWHQQHDYVNIEFRIEAIPGVINLTTEKARVFQEEYRIHKLSGRAMISDVTPLEELPEKLRANAA
jgi:hypothetical protein